MNTEDIQKGTVAIGAILSEPGTLRYLAPDVAHGLRCADLQLRAALADLRSAKNVATDLMMEQADEITRLRKCVEVADRVVKHVRAEAWDQIDFQLDAYDAARSEVGEWTA